MVYAGKPGVSVKVSGIATTREGAQAFVERLVMQTVYDVLENQGRSALLPDAVISSILSQLTVRISYEPLPCQEVVLNLAADMGGSIISKTHSNDSKLKHRRMKNYKLFDVDEKMDNI
ncbi:hypothetical protein KIN20_030351 [Parelaphostrongylus tenuis]|uniref:Uncharacterized protein n=1 Tax=Parelaphostrongylus tenuis TaxID=148309 RepID=A0AAD5R3Y3_PARTN|nr:hypothetical protein KIN20_030351 [Parelaphostrongylus tenuis]